MHTVDGIAFANAMVLFVLCFFILKISPTIILIHSSSHSAHYFCKKCILDCAKANGKCPLCKSDVSRREVKPDAMMTEMIELYKKLVVKVVKEEEEDKEEEEEKKSRSVPYMSQLPITQNT